MVQPGKQGPQVSNDVQGPAPVRAWLSRGRLGDTTVIFCQLRESPEGGFLGRGTRRLAGSVRKGGGRAASSGLGGQSRAELEAGQQGTPGQETWRGAAALPRQQARPAQAPALDPGEADLQQAPLGQHHSVTAQVHACASHSLREFSVGPSVRPTRRPLPTAPQWPLGGLQYV